MDLASYFLFLILMVVLCFLIFIVVIKIKVKGKVIALVLGRSRDANFVLSRKTAGGKLADVAGSNGKEFYRIDDKCASIAKYPFTPLPIIQCDVPCFVYKEGNPEPLNPETLQQTKGLSPKQWGKLFDEKIIDEIVKSLDPDKKKQLKEWMTPVIVIVCTVMLLGMIYLVNTDVSVISQKVDRLYDQGQVVRGN